MHIRILVAITALSLPLSGCWTGNDFYDQSNSEAAVPAGKYKIVNREGPISSGDIADFGKQLTLSYDKTGLATVTVSEDGSDSAARLFKLGDKPGLYVVQADMGAPLPGIGSSLYGLLQVMPGGYQIAVPRCDQKRAAFWDRAIVSGLLVGKPVCKFSSRANFEAAMLDYAKDPISWTEYRQVTKRPKKPQ
jgi:hypothetical protein